MTVTFWREVRERETFTNYKNGFVHIYGLASCVDTWVSKVQYELSVFMCQHVDIKVSTLWFQKFTVSSM